MDKYSLQKYAVGLAMAYAVAVFSASIASARITVDGDDSDWSSIGVAIDDPNETDPDPLKNIPDYWDMDELYYRYDSPSQDMYWMMKTYDSIVPNLGYWDEETVYLFIDADRNTSTGCNEVDRSYGLVGSDYRLSWILGSDSVSLRQWNSSFSTWTPVSGYTISRAASSDAQYEYDVFEISFSRAAIEDVWANGDGWISWGWAYDNRALNPDDMSPDAGFYDSRAPEPGTLALLVLGLGALYTRRRKTSK